MFFEEQKSVIYGDNQNDYSMMLMMRRGSIINEQHNPIDQSEIYDNQELLR
jgi:hypothetical protein